jgi:anti-sigma-K factor RskA
MDTNRHVTDHIPAYALDSLDEAEARYIQAHLERCEICMAELVEYRQLVGNLAFAAPQFDPPPALKTKLMDRIKPRLETSDQTDAPESWWGRLNNKLPQLSPAWGFAAVAIILVLAISNVLLWQQVNRSQPPPPLRVIGLQGGDAAPQATGMIVVSVDGEHGTLVVDHLPQLREDQEYQLWLIQDGERTSGALFSVGEDGYGSVWVGSPEPLIEYSRFGVTIEPKGGSPGPTGANVLRSDL